MPVAMQKMYLEDDNAETTTEGRKVRHFADQAAMDEWLKNR